MVGFGRKGQMLARLLTEEKIPFVAIDMDPHNVAVARKKMLPVYYGDATRPEVLQAIGVERADMVVFTSALLKSVERPIRSIRALFPELTIIARSATRQTADELRAAGANVVVEENLESGLQLGAALLRTRGTAPYEVQRVIEHLRHAEAQN
jgi:voltage-gated potassium channel Kch